MGIAIWRCGRCYGVQLSWFGDTKNIRNYIVFKNGRFLVFLYYMTKVVKRVLSRTKNGREQKITDVAESVHIGSKKFHAVSATIVPRTITNGTLEWYDLTEQTKAILNNRLSQALKLRAQELRRVPRNEVLLSSLEKEITNIQELNDNPDTFRTLASMRKILSEYVGRTSTTSH